MGAYGDWVSRVTGERLTGAIAGVAFAGVLLSGWLVVSELVREPTCPLLFGVPACFFVFAGYVAVIVGAWMSRPAGAVLFFAGAGAVTLIAVYLSFRQVVGTIECPSFEGLPMCYVSLFAGMTVLILEQVRRRLPDASDTPGR